jgi:hypothetical protein
MGWEIPETGKGDSEVKDISEAAAPVKIDRPLLEAEIQSACVKWMRGRGYWARKFSSMSQRSVPDYLFARNWMTHESARDGIDGGNRWAKIKFATEFKREDAPIHKDTGCMSTKAQVEEQQAMRDAGWFVFENNDVDKFKITVLSYEQECVTDTSAAEPK